MQYLCPNTVDEAVGLLARQPGSCKILAGGTDLLVRMRSGSTEPEAILDIKRIDEVQRITEEDGGFRIGAAVPSAQMSEHAALAGAWPGVVEAASLIGSTQIQGRATIAGNLCNASPAADSVPALVAAGAMARVAGPGGIRDMEVQAIPQAPGRTSLGTGEFVTSIFLPARGPRASDAYLRFIPRTEMDIAVVGCGISLTFDDGGVCTTARVALGAVGPKVILAEAAGQALVGTTVDEAALEALAAAASAAATPISDKRGTVAFRTHVAGVLARRAAVIARTRAGGKS